MEVERRKINLKASRSVSLRNSVTKRRDDDEIDPQVNRYALTIRNSKLLWTETAEVILSKAAEGLSKNEKNIQELKFEILTSEATFVKSLRMFENHYAKNIQLANILLEDDCRTLFEDVQEVRCFAEAFFADLDDVFIKDVSMDKIFLILEKHLSELQTFDVYLTYARRFPRVQQCFEQLMSGGWKFRELTLALSRHAIAEGQTMDSLLLPPIQRVPRLGLLLKNIKGLMSGGHRDLERVQRLSAKFEKLTEGCDENVGKTERQEETRKISSLLIFPRTLLPIILVEESRHFLERVSIKEVAAGGPGSGVITRPLEVFLFNDCMLLAKKSSGVFGSNGRYKVKDYGFRKDMDAAPVQVLSLIGQPELRKLQPITLGFMSTKHCRRVEMVISFNEEQARGRWLEALNSYRDNPILSAILFGGKAINRNTFS